MEWISPSGERVTVAISVCQVKVSNPVFASACLFKYLAVCSLCS